MRSGFNQDGIGQVLSYTLSVQSVFSGNSIWFLLLLIYHSRVISKPDQLAKMPLYQHELRAYESVSPCLIGLKDKFCWVALCWRHVQLCPLAEPLGQGSWTVTIWTFRGWFPKMRPLFAQNNWKLIWRR